eukprot:2101604-Pleurochrysis_carterae.AAC.3
MRGRCCAAAPAAYLMRLTGSYPIPRLLCELHGSVSVSAALLAQRDMRQRKHCCIALRHCAVRSHPCGLRDCGNPPQPFSGSVGAQPKQIVIAA